MDTVKQKVRKLASFSFLKSSSLPRRKGLEHHFEGNIRHVDM